MIRINNIKLKIGYKNEDIEQAIRKSLRINSFLSYKMAKLSIDSRKKDQINYVASVDVSCDQEEKILKNGHKNNIMLFTWMLFKIREHGSMPMQYRPVIIGSGPAGLFAGLFLAREGYRPIILERGMAVDERTACVNGYWKKEHPLNPNCNVQFGEGGAGTFSDGKLNTVIKDKSGRRTAVLKTFVEFGADPSILYVNKPHIGTDVLLTVVKYIRNDIIRLGGEVRIEQLLKDIEEILKNRYGISNSEVTEGVTAVAVPILGAKGELLYGLTISGPSNRFSEEIQEMMKENLLKISEHLENELKIFKR